MRPLTFPFAIVGLAGGWFFGLAMSDRADAPELWILALVTPCVAGILGHLLASRPPYLGVAFLAPIAGMFNGLICGVIYTRSPVGLFAAPFGILWAVPFVPPLVAITAAQRKVGRAREGSIVDRADRRRVYTVTLGCVAVTMLGAAFSKIRWWQPGILALPILASLACALVTLVILAKDTAAWRRVRALARVPTRPRSELPAQRTLDFGLADEEREVLANAPTYRDAEIVAAAYRGDASLAQKALRAHLIIDAACVILSMAAIGSCGTTAIEMQHRRTAIELDAQP